MRISLRDISIACAFVLLHLGVTAQQYNYPLNKYSRNFLLSTDSVHHGAFQGQPVRFYDVDTIKGMEPKTRYSTFDRKLYDEHLFELHAPDLDAHIDLLLNFEIGTELWEDNDYQDTTRMSRNMRGMILEADLGEKVSISTSFMEFQSSVPWYLYQYGLKTLVMPGSGRVKAHNRTGFDHNIAQGYVSYSPDERVNIQFGNEKNFIGSGYRSLLLSDNAYSYPQVKMQFELFKGLVQYHLIHAWLQTLDRLPRGDTPESLFVRKNGSFKYLEVHPLKGLSIGFFEGVIWDRYDPVEGTLPVEPIMYSPVIGTSALALGLDDPDHKVILGLDIGIRPINELLVYGQYVVDKEQRNGYQIGFRTIDLGVDGLSVRAEYNAVDPYTYTHSPRSQGYHHFAQAIAHPMGAGFDELSAGLMFFHKRWFLDVGYISADQLVDQVNEEGELCAAGGDIFSVPTCSAGDDLEAYRTHLEQIDLRLGRMFNPKSNFNVYFGWLYRDRHGGGLNEGQSLATFGIEMSLFDRYEDF